MISLGRAPDSGTGLNKTFVAHVNARAKDCGFFAYLEEALTFPPTGRFTAPDTSAPGCNIWYDVIAAAIEVNPCFNVYHFTDYCPFLWSELGFPSLATVRIYIVIFHLLVN